MKPILYITILFILSSLIQCRDQSRHYPDIVRQYQKISAATSVHYPKIHFIEGPGGNIKSFTTNIIDTSKTTFREIIPKESIKTYIDNCNRNILKTLSSPRVSDTILLHANWILANLKAMKYLVEIEEGMVGNNFDKESFNLFGIQAPSYSEQYYKLINSGIDSLIDGDGTTFERYAELSHKFTIPGDKIDTVFKSIIYEARRRTKSKLLLPENESVQILFTAPGNYKGRYGYLGNNKGTIQIHADYPFTILDAVETACHEGYAGHHVYNILMGKYIEENDLEELAFSPVIGPAGFMAEALASYNSEIVFPENDLKRYMKEVLLPLAGLDTTYFELFLKCHSLRSGVDYLPVDISRGLSDGTMTDEIALRWLNEYGFVGKDLLKTSLDNIKRSGTRIISYNYGADLVKEYINRYSITDDTVSRWNACQWLMTHFVTPAYLADKVPLTNK
jgi:hypothetical protein